MSGKSPLIALITDFGVGSPYVGQMHLKLSEVCPHATSIALISDLPPFRPDLSAYLIPGLTATSPSPCFYVCVVDPGVGGKRAAIALEADGNWYVGPDNGLLAIVGRRALQAAWWRIDWRPEQLSRSFHGRDLFAPMAARIAAGVPSGLSTLDTRSITGMDWPDDLSKVIYCDTYGNLLCGIRVSSLDSAGVRITAGGVRLSRAGTFDEISIGQAFWYENSLGLVEIAVNQGRADQVLGLKVGDPLAIG